jgi:hypothetical protein
LPEPNHAATCVRQVRLALAAALRRAGYAPWLLAMGVLAIAALQEPAMLRAYGIRLPWQAAWAIGFGLVAVLASGLPGSRFARTQVSASLALTSLVALALAALLALVDLSFGRAGALANALLWWLGFVLSFYQFAIVQVAVRGARWPLAAAALATAALLAVVLAVRFDGRNWSAPVLAATLLAALAATAAARAFASGHHAHRHPR